MARKGMGNVDVSYNSQDITAYCNSAALNTTIDEIETTNFASTSGESMMGDRTWTIPIGGQWDNAVDAILAPDVVAGTGTLRTAVVTLTGSSATVTYTWTSKAYIADYEISSEASGLIEWSATLNCNGAPVRGSA